MDSNKRRRCRDIVEKVRDWSNPPTDILLDISQRLDDNNSEKRFEIRRLRSVCTSWRNSIVQPHNTLPLTLQPHPNYSLSESALYVLSPPQGTQDSGCWLIKVRERPDLGIWYLENPLSVRPELTQHPEFFSGPVNIFGCGIKEITRSYVLDWRLDQRDRTVSKVVIARRNPKHKADDFTALVLFNNKTLGLLRPGEADWTSLKIKGVSDIINFEGKFYVSGVKGKLFMIDAVTYKVDEILDVGVTDWYFYRSHTNLVESRGRLYMLLKDMAKPRYARMAAPPKEFRVYVLESNNNNNSRWTRVENLGDRVFFVTEYVSFSVSPQCLGWSEGNCVIFALQGLSNFFNKHESTDDDFDVYYQPAIEYDSTDDDDDDDLDEYLPGAADYRGCFAVYTLDDSKISVANKTTLRYSRIFWPPPDWVLSMLSEESPPCLCATCGDPPDCHVCVRRLQTRDAIIHSVSLGCISIL